MSNLASWEEELLTAVKSGTKSLTTLVEAGPISKIPVFQIGTVQQWLDSEIGRFTPAPQDLTTSEKEWYLKRKKTFIGPVSLAELADFGRRSLIEKSDLLVNPKRKYLVTIEDLKRMTPSSEIKPDFFTSRRFARTPFEAWVKIRGRELQIAAQSLEISVQGMSLYMKAAALPGEMFEIEVCSPDSGLNMRVQARLCSAIPVLDGYRCGFEFADISKDDRKQILRYVETTKSRG